MWRFWLGTLSRIPYALLFARRSGDHLSRLIFNRRSQLEASRDNLLQYVVDEFAVAGTPFDSGGILTKMYKFKWYSHPAATSARVRTNYLLESFVETGDLKKSADGRYLVAPLAFKTLADMREAQRRHKQSMGTQYALVFLTIGTFFAALIQGGIVQVPPLLMVDCKLKHGVAQNCTLRWHLWPDNSASTLLNTLRSAVRRYIN
jgi:hypothetical protein